MTVYSVLHRSTLPKIILRAACCKKCCYLTECCYSVIFSNVIWAPETFSSSGESNTTLPVNAIGLSVIYLDLRSTYITLPVRRSVLWCRISACLLRRVRVVPKIPYFRRHSRPSVSAFQRGSLTGFNYLTSYWFEGVLHFRFIFKDITVWCG
jgi:hypothetical protein